MTTTQTQNARVEAMMREGWVCGTTFLAAMIPRYSARIGVVKGLLRIMEPEVMVARRVCGSVYHGHETRQFEWRIIDRQGVII